MSVAKAVQQIALQMLEERGRGAVLVGVARVDAALEHLLQAVMVRATDRDDGLFLPDRPLGSLGAKVALASRLGLIDGHLRAEATPDQLVPVLVLDVSALEADKLLADPDPKRGSRAIDILKVLCAGIRGADKDRDTFVICFRGIRKGLERVEAQIGVDRQAVAGGRGVCAKKGACIALCCRADVAPFGINQDHKVFISGETSKPSGQCDAIGTPRLKQADLGLHNGYLAGEFFDDSAKKAVERFELALRAKK